MTDQKIIQVDGLEVLLIRSRRRTLSLEISAQGQVKARAPMRMPQYSVKEFIQSKRPWIEKHLSNQQPALEPITLDNGALLPLQGTTLVLQINLQQRGPIQQQDEHLIVPITESHLCIEQSVRNKLIVWYKKMALQQLHHQINHFAPLMGLASERFTKTKTREYKKRWGSCDHAGQLSFNWRIIMAPTEVLDYVVVHELAHCHEFNHSKRFWHIVEQTMPDWKNAHQWLQHNGAQLYLF